MKRLVASVVLIVLAAIGLAAQEKAASAKKNEVRWHGTIVLSSKDASTILVRKHGGTTELMVHYTSATQWTKLNKPADPSEFKDGSRVICLGNYDANKKFVAIRIELREPAP